MNKPTIQTLIVEHSQEGCIDILSDGSSHNGVTVTAKIENGKLYLNVDAFHGEGASEWSIHEFECSLPEFVSDEGA